MELNDVGHLERHVVGCVPIKTRLRLGEPFGEAPRTSIALRDTSGAMWPYTSTVTEIPEWPRIWKTTLSGTRWESIVDAAERRRVYSLAGRAAEQVERCADVRLLLAQHCERLTCPRPRSNGSHPTCPPWESRLRRMGPLLRRQSR